MLHSNFPTPWACVRLAKCRARPFLTEARRVLAKLRELHQPLHLGPTSNQGEAWGSTCVDKTCVPRPDAMLHQKRPETTLVPSRILWESSDVSVGTIGNLLELE